MIQNYRQRLSIHQKRELWNLVIEQRGDMAKVATKLRLQQNFIELEFLELFIECLLKVNHHLGAEENRIFIERLTIENVVIIVEQASKNTYYTSIKNLNILLSMMQCTLQVEKNLGQNLIEMERITTKFDSLLFEIKAFFWDQIDLHTQPKVVVVKNDATTQGSFQDIFIQLDIEEQQSIKKQESISDKEFLEQLNKIMCEKQIPYWDQMVVRWNLMQKIFNNNK